MPIEKEVNRRYFRQIVEGNKNFELRLADFKCQPGDTLLLREWDPESEEYTGRQVSKEVGYVLKTDDLDFWSEEEIKKYGYQIIAFKS